MKKFILAFVAAICSATLAFSDVYIGPFSTTNRLILRESQLLLIHRVVPPPPSLERPAQPVQFVTATRTNEIFFGFESAANPSAVIGPGEFILNDNTVVNYSLLPASNARQVFVPQIEPNGVVDLQIPAGKSFRFFQPVGFEFAAAKLERGFTQSDRYDIRGGEVLNGPLTIHFIPLPDRPTNFQPSYYLTYIENLSVPVFPQAAAIRTPADTSLLQIQTSDDLETWLPAIELPVSNQSERFYRLRVERK